MMLRENDNSVVYFERVLGVVHVDSSYINPVYFEGLDGEQETPAIRECDYRFIERSRYKLINLHAQIQVANTVKLPMHLEKARIEVYTLTVEEYEGCYEEGKTPSRSCEYIVGTTGHSPDEAYKLLRRKKVLFEHVESVLIEGGYPNHGEFDEALQRKAKLRILSAAMYKRLLSRKHYRGLSCITMKRRIHW